LFFEVLEHKTQIFPRHQSTSSASSLSSKFAFWMEKRLSESNKQVLHCETHGLQGHDDTSLITFNENEQKDEVVCVFVSNIQKLFLNSIQSQVFFDSFFFLFFSFLILILFSQSFCTLEKSQKLLRVQIQVQIQVQFKFNNKKWFNH
jgi:hypothetical protein